MGRIRTVATLAAAATIVAIPNPVHADDPPLIIDGDITIDDTDAHDVRIASTTTITADVIDAKGFQIGCDDQTGSRVECASDGTLVTITVTATGDAESGQLLVTDETGRTALVAISVASDPEPVQPSTLTFTVEGCEAWYASRLLGCPKGGGNATVTENVDPALDLPEGTGVVTGEQASAGTVTFPAADQGASDHEMSVAGLDRFGTFTGRLGTGDDEVTLEVKRRAPWQLGAFAVLFGAGLAASLSWFTNRMLQLAGARKTVDAYTKRHARLTARQALLKPKLTAPERESWWLDPLKPASLAPKEQRDADTVKAYTTAAEETDELWDVLDGWLTLRGLLQNKSTAPLAKFVDHSIVARRTGEHDQTTDLLTLTARVLRAWTDDELVDVYQADSFAELIAAVDQGTKLLVNTTINERSIVVDGPPPKNWPVPPPAAPGAPAPPAVLAVAPESWLKGFGRQAAAKAASRSTILTVCITAILLAVVAWLVDIIEQPDATVFVLLAASTGLVWWVVARAIVANGLGVIAAGLIGILLAAAFAVPVMRSIRTPHGVA